MGLYTKVTDFTPSTSFNANSTPVLIRAGPVKRSSTQPLSSSVRTSSTLEFSDFIAGRRVWSVCSTEGKRDLGEKGAESTCKTSFTQSNVSHKTFSTPIFIVVVRLGQLPQAPVRTTCTDIVLTSTLASSMSPPSAWRNGRILELRICKTLEEVKGSFCGEDDNGGVDVVSKGEIFVSHSSLPNSNLSSSSNPSSKSFEGCLRQGNLGKVVETEVESRVLLLARKAFCGMVGRRMKAGENDDEVTIRPRNRRNDVAIAVSVPVDG